MSAVEVAEICENLPPAKREAVAEFARFLLSQEDDSRWEVILKSTATRPNLDKFLEESRSSGDETLDLRLL